MRDLLHGGSGKTFPMSKPNSRSTGVSHPDVSAIADAYFPNQTIDDIRRAMTPGSVVLNRRVDAVAVLAFTHMGIHWMGVVPAEEAMCYVETHDIPEWLFVPIQIHLPNLPGSIDTEAEDMPDGAHLVCHPEFRGVQL